MTSLFLLCAAALGALGGKEKKNEKNISESEVPAVERKLIQITGTVRLVGSSPFFELVITNSDHSWYVYADEVYKLRDLQQRTVTVEGEESTIELTFANGLPAGTRRELRNVKIISVQ